MLRTIIIFIQKLLSIYPIQNIFHLQHYWKLHAHRDISYKILTIQAITTHLILLQITAFVEQGRNYSVQENLGLRCILYIHYIYRKCNAGHYTIS